MIADGHFIFFRVLCGHVWVNILILSPQKSKGSQENIDYNISTKILEVNLFAFAYRLFHEDFSPIDGRHEQSVGKCKQINF